MAVAFSAVFAPLPHFRGLFPILRVFFFFRASPDRKGSMSARPKILFLIPHLGGGGAEQVVSLLVRHISRADFEPHLALITQAEVDPHAVPADVRLHPLGARRVRNAAWPLLKLIRRLQPDVIFSGIFHLSFLVLLLRPLLPKKTRIVIRQNGTVSQSLTLDELPFYTRFLYQRLYPRADRIVCQSAAMARDLASVLPLPEEKLVVLANPLEIGAIRERAATLPSQWLGEGPHLLAVGRLSHEKGMDLLLAALTRLRENFLDANLVLAGEGPEASALESQSAVSRLDAVVRFAGHLPDPAEYFPGASCFVLPSRHEGLPNALLEAAAAGLPIVSSPASEGLVELIDGQPGCWLAEEPTAESLCTALQEALHTLEPGERFPHPWVERFAIEHSLPAYESFFRAVAKEAV